MVWPRRENFPQGLEPWLILVNLRHATHPLGGYPARALSKHRDFGGRDDGYGLSGGTERILNSRSLAEVAAGSGEAALC